MSEPYATIAMSVVCLSSLCLSVCLSHVRSRKLREIGAKFCCLYRKSGSPSKNKTSDFALEVAKYNFENVRAHCFAPLAMQLVDLIVLILLC